jgi:hypothetical protein
MASKPQVNILLTRDERDLLEAVAFIEESTVSELLRPIVLDFVATKRNDQEVEAALAALIRRRAAKRSPHD